MANRHYEEERARLAARGSTQRTGSSQSSSGMSSAVFSAGLNAINAAHQNTSRAPPSDGDDSNITWLDDDREAGVTSDFAAMNLQRNSSSHNHAYGQSAHARPRGDRSNYLQGVEPGDSISEVGEPWEGTGTNRGHSPAMPGMLYPSNAPAASGNEYSEHRSHGSSGTARGSGLTSTSQHQREFSSARPGGTTQRGSGTVVSAMTTNAGPEGNVYWPELRRNLTSDAALNNFTVICPVCATSMRAVASNNRNQAKILHCGHMLCMECTIRICANIDGSRDNPHGRKPKCPMCKERLGKYPHCGESCQAPGRIGFPMPKNMEEMRYLPRTMPEGGSDPSCCKICRIKRIERTSQRLVGLILNDTKSRAKWNPTVDQAKQEAGDFSDYIQVPELQRLLDVLAETVRDPKIYQKYANLYPQQFASDQRAVAEMKDRKRDAL